MVKKDPNNVVNPSLDNLDVEKNRVLGIKSFSRLF
jgi:hypothetical protein